MAADPNPFNRVADQLADGAVMIAYPYGEPIRSAAP
jgi:hypothetical protein